MLFGNESISHYTPSNVFIWMTMAFQAGLLNIGGFLACHRFVSHVTGFATHFGFDLSQASYSHALGMLAAPFFFLYGSMVSGQLVDIRLKLHKKPNYYIVFGLIFVLCLAVFAAGVENVFGPFGKELSGPQDYLLLALLCLVCGIQNGTISTVSNAVIRTTHLTGITTDLGLGIARILNRRKLSGLLKDEGRANLMRLGIIASFGIGSIVGAFAFNRFQYYGFALPVLTSGGLFFLMLYFQVIRKVRVQ